MRTLAYLYQNLFRKNSFKVHDASCVQRLCIFGLYGAIQMLLLLLLLLLLFKLCNRNVHYADLFKRKMINKTKRVVIPYISAYKKWGSA